ncbi:DUF1266 domain-containing protein [Methanolapillus ohkumae]|uniref:DUF1266 domain-containing protein n=1 Tax=Methanolapillus ohkumae TaxID=3028298 RepID=A0AA96V7A6_9EURY|nr:hypothetical protein MsAm2_12600 [Methanosarcinaceae archaeon Am2]
MIDISMISQKLKDVFERMFLKLNTDHADLLVNEIEIFACYEEGFMNILVKNGGYISRKYLSDELFEEYMDQNADSETLFLASELFLDWTDDIAVGPSMTKEEFHDFLKSLVVGSLKSLEDSAHFFNSPVFSLPVTVLLKIFGCRQTIVFFKDISGKNQWAVASSGDVSENLDRLEDTILSGKSHVSSFQKIEKRMNAWIVLPDKDPKSEFLFAEDFSLREAQYWALACAAPISLRDGFYLDSLQVKGGEERARADLSMFWQVESRKELIQTLDSLWYEGQHLNYDLVLESVLNLPWPEWKSEIEKFTQENEDGENTFTLIPHLESMETAFYILKQEKIIQTETVPSVLAWDLGCFIHVCRLGFAAGFIREEEAWDSIMPAALILQEEFESWEDLSVSYLTGAIIWNNSYREQEAVLKNHTLLTQRPESPFLTLPWGLELD